jgi:hypothetical protein
MPIAIGMPNYCFKSKHVEFEHFSYNCRIGGFDFYYQIDRAFSF